MRPISDYIVAAVIVALCRAAEDFTDLSGLKNLRRDK